MPTVTEKPSQTNTGSSAAGPSSSNQEAPISSASNAPAEQQLNLDVDYGESNDTASPVQRTPKKKPPVRPSSGVESILSHRRLGSQSMPFPQPSTPPSFARAVQALPRSAQPAQPSILKTKGRTENKASRAVNIALLATSLLSLEEGVARNSPEQQGGDGGDDGGDDDDNSRDDGSTNPDDDGTPVPFRWREIPTPEYDEGPAAMIRALFQSQKDWKDTI